ncbi:sulfatase-modifying factor enzyme 1 [Rhodobacter aestuarii]|uniref:Sulfatase-modifying factor enzyme 1 n=1 Tax=Rhodobacter aestuarii TaxID=453582 RepID=A0A1N7Q0L7_9RHOB|nr:SUMF1/EgtB/PvdO family nonheme iron enzyme [Rhodobacter aestuarii]PTV94005.1 sulfatase-modifying factor enzyme 1 [Rhodobacter aestuarii]SIT16433.1 Sulfatase-modifying factor enzyme 1 [Rhodobacter aestuarii]
MSIIISAPDALRQSVEAASGGQNTVLYDVAGYPSVMCVVPRFNIEDIDPALGSGAHPAFIVNGVARSEIFVGKYLASVHDNHALSLPGQDPAASINFDTADARCSIKGPGWHMMTNAEWSAVALWSWKNGTMPRGNTYFGRDYDQKYETGRRQDGAAPGDATGSARTLTGSGPVSWLHDGSPAGIADLTGNVWEWQRGLRLVDGEIQIIPDNDAAATNADHSATSALWRAILQDGTLVAPGTADTLKWDATGATGTGSPQLATAVTSQSDGSTYMFAMYKDLGAASGVTAPNLLKLLGAFPHDTTIERGRVYVRNIGERLPLRGGNWGNGGDAGVFALSLSGPRSRVDAGIGFRPAFVI